MFAAAPVTLFTLGLNKSTVEAVPYVAAVPALSFLSVTVTRNWTVFPVVQLVKSSKSFEPPVTVTSASVFAPAALSDDVIVQPVALCNAPQPCEL